jgi:hypothetical protein
MSPAWDGFLAEPAQSRQAHQRGVDVGSRRRLARFQELADPGHFPRRLVRCNFSEGGGLAWTSCPMNCVFIPHIVWCNLVQFGAIWCNSVQLAEVDCSRKGCGCSPESLRCKGSNHRAQQKWPSQWIGTTALLEPRSETRLPLFGSGPFRACLRALTLPIAHCPLNYSSCSSAHYSTSRNGKKTYGRFLGTIYFGEVQPTLVVETQQIAARQSPKIQEKHKIKC